MVKIYSPGQGIYRVYFSPTMQDHDSKGVDHLITGNHIWNQEKRSFLRGEVIVRAGYVEDISFGNPLPSDATRGAERLSLGDDLLFPAFLDSHMHLYQWSISRQGINLNGCRSSMEIVNTLERVKNGSLPNRFFEEMGVLIGNDYDESRFVKGENLNGDLLQRFFPDTSVILRRICGHKAIVNEMGADLLGVEPDLFGFILEGKAMEIIWGLNIDIRTAKIFLKEAIKELHTTGVVGGVEILPSSRIDEFKEVFRKMSGSMNLAISIIKEGDNSSQKGIFPVNWDEEVHPHHCSDPPIIFQKLFLDGSIGSRTASFSEPYTDGPMIPTIHSDRALEEIMGDAAMHGLVPMMHCIGDRAVSQAIRIAVKFDRPFRLEHAESITEKHLASMKGGKGALSMQPNFSAQWGREGGLYERALGERGKVLNPFRTIDRSWVPWCFGTDMMPPGPLFAIKGAVYPQDPSQSISTIRSLQGFTTNVSDISFIRQRSPGTLSIGAPADLIVIDKTMINVKKTFKKGIVVHSL